MSTIARLARPAMRAGALSRPAARPLPLPFAVPLRARPLSTSVGLGAAPRAAPPLGRRLNSTLSSSSGPSGSGGSGSSEPPKSAYARFKELTKTYGSYAVVMYLALSAVDFSLSFAVVHAVGAEHIEPGLNRLVRWYRELRHGVAGADALEAADTAQKAADAAEEAADKILGREAWYANKTLWAEATLAYAIHKIGFLPIRAGLTVAWTPKVVNFLRARGWIGTSGAKRAAQHGADKMRQASKRAVGTAKDAVKRRD